MTLQVPISAETQAKLQAKAAGAGVDVQTFAAKALERIASRPSLAELLAPVRAEFEESDMSEEELTTLLEAAKHEMRAGRRGRRRS